MRSMTPEAPRMRPMTAGDIIDEAIRLYRRHFRMFIIIGAVVLVPLGLLQIVLTLIAQAAGLVAVGLLSFLSSILSFFAYLTVWGASISAASSLLVGEQTNERQAYDQTLGKLGPLVGLALLYAIAVGLLMLATFFILGAVGIYFAVAWIFAYHVLVIEGRGVMAALGRSRDLVRGHWWRVVGIGIVAIIIQIVVVMAFTIPAMFFGAGGLTMDPMADVSAIGAVLNTIGNTAGTIIAGPILYCVATMLYYDLRMRKEGFDIELAARQMEAELAEPPRPGPAF
jgi:hypothetical protein